LRARLRQKLMSARKQNSQDRTATLVILSEHVAQSMQHAEHELPYRHLGMTWSVGQLPEPVMRLPPQFGQKP